MFENPRRGRQARNFTTNVSKILDLKSSSEQIFFRKLSLGAPVICTHSCSKINYNNENIKSNSLLSGPSGLLSICYKNMFKILRPVPSRTQTNTTTFPTFLSFSADIENVFQIWSTLVGYKELVGVFEPVKNEKYFG